MTTQNVAIYEYLLENCIPLIPIQRGLKKPLTPNGKWQVIDDPDHAFMATGNVGVYLGEVEVIQRISPVIAVGWDKYKPTANDAFKKLQSLGASPKANVWSMATGRGGITWFYAYDGEPLPKASSAGGDSALDLLTNGYTLIPESETSKVPPDKTCKKWGGPYTWFDGHSPLDIPVHELDHPPEALLAYWRSFAPRASIKPDDWNRDKNLIVVEALGSGFRDGERDTKLTSLAAYLTGCGLSRESREAVMRRAALLCETPFDENEAIKKLDSAERKFGERAYHHGRPVKLLNGDAIVSDTPLDGSQW